MPNIKGLTVQEAQDLLESNDSFLLDKKYASGQDRTQAIDGNCKVCSPSAGAGTPLSILDFVTLSAVKADESCP